MLQPFQKLGMHGRTDFMTDWIVTSDVFYPKIGKPSISALGPYDGQCTVMFTMTEKCAQVCKSCTVCEMWFQFGQDTSRENGKALDAFRCAQGDAGAHDPSLAESGDYGVFRLNAIR